MEIALLRAGELSCSRSAERVQIYLLGKHFTIVADCNALKATSMKKELIPEIARWWLQLQEFDFDVIYRPGTGMRHVDALRRNPPHSVGEESILHIKQSDWILSRQLIDARMADLKEILSRTPSTDIEHKIHSAYVVRDGRVYRRTKKGYSGSSLKA